MDKPIRTYVLDCFDVFIFFKITRINTYQRDDHHVISRRSSAPVFVSKPSLPGALFREAAGSPSRLRDARSPKTMRTARKPIKDRVDHMSNRTNLGIIRMPLGWFMILI